MAITTTLHYKNENQNYHHSRIERKEKSLQTHIQMMFEENNEIDSRDKAISLMKDKLKELSTVHKLTINLYKLDGSFYASSKNDTQTNKLGNSVINNLSNKAIYIKAVESNKLLEQTNLLSYSFIKFNNENLLILYLPYTHENTIFKSELENILINFGELYLFLLLGAVVFAYLVSRYITQSLKKISSVLNKTDLGKNKPFSWNSNDEIGKLVTAYNDMVAKLDESAILLAKSEREQAWREMAKQVAHEIKNPLTPMRLEVQLLERNATKLENEKDRKKVLDFTNGMILQIDTLSRIANEFSNFAQMPAQQLMKIDFSEFAQRFSKLHSHSSIKFNIEDKPMPVCIDEKQFSRVLNNLIKNSEQSIPKDRTADIQVNVKHLNEKILITISDNGIGISDKEKVKVFEPKFTTKSGGMGLGLGIVKNIIESIGGEISFNSAINIGTTFYIHIPKSNK